jgi:divalent metal cation (Fe/Co/Zn/Cd) transporter
VRELAAEIQGVTNVEKCHTRKMGVLNHADLHIWVDGSLSVTEGHTISHAVKDHIQEVLPQFADVMIHIEPDGHHHV